MTANAKPLNQPPAARPYRKLVKACAERDIGRTTAFLLRKAGLIETFRIGSQTYCYLDDLDALPTRLADPEVQRHVAAVKRGDA
jgi:hypothetical protein